jgi:hypothetical protein
MLGILEHDLPEHILMQLKSQEGRHILALHWARNELLSLSTRFLVRLFRKSLSFRETSRFTPHPLMSFRFLFSAAEDRDASGPLCAMATSPRPADENIFAQFHE